MPGDYPERPERLTLRLGKKAIELTADEIKTLLKVKTEYEREVAIFDAAHQTKRREIETGLVNALRRDIEFAYDIGADHPKRDALWELAWDQRDSGYRAVEEHYGKLV
jgi:hypothetical protein